MKKIYALLFFAITLLPLGAQTLTWSSEITVADGSTYGNVRPRIALDSMHNPVVMWGGGTASQPLYAAHWNGSAFSMPATLTPAGVSPFIDTWSGADMASNGNSVFVVFKREPETSSYMYAVHSSDGGVTWGDTMRIDPGNGLYSRFPSVMVNSAGNPVVMYMNFDSAWGMPGYSVCTSNDGGMTYAPPVLVSGVAGAEVCDCCPGYLALDGNTQVAAWRRNNNNQRDMWMAVSSDGGMSFPFGDDIDNTNWMVTSCPSTGPDPFISGDTLVTVFMSRGGNNLSRIRINTYNLTTQQSGFTTMLASNYASTAIQNYPFIAGSGDTMVVVWQQVLMGNMETYYAWTTTGASGLVNTEAILNSSSAGTQQNPHVAYANGEMHFVFTDLATGDVIYKKAWINFTGISEATAPQLRVFPNPSAGTVQLDLAPLAGEHATLVVTDLSGRVVEEKTVTGAQVELSQQVAGTYCVTVTTESGLRYVTRVVFR